MANYHLTRFPGHFRPESRSSACVWPQSSGADLEYLSALHNCGLSQIVRDIDATKLLIQLNVDASEIAKRRTVRKAPAPRSTLDAGQVLQIGGNSGQGRCDGLPWLASRQDMIFAALGRPQMGML